MKLSTAFAALTVLSSVVASPGAAAALTQDEIAMLTAPNRQAILEEGAKKEAALTWLCSMIEDSACRPITAEFQKKYPYLKSTFVSTNSAEALQRALAEKRANRVTIDVMQASVASSLKGTGLAQRFVSPEFAGYDPVMIDKNNEYIAIWSLQNGLTWNTKQVPAADAPKRWEDLLNPKLKGKLFWSSGATSAPRMIMHFRMWLGDDKAMEFLKQLRANDIHTVSGDSGSWVVGILSGEYGVFVGQPVYQIAPDKAKGAPVDGTNPDPSATRTSAMALMNQAPHPHAAMLFIDFLLSDQGQKLLAEAGQTPTRRGVPANADNNWFAPATLGHKEVVLTQEKDDELRASSQKIYQEMFR